MNQIIVWDKKLFQLINQQFSNSFFDWIMPWLRNSPIWTPLYLFIILFVLINFKKNAWWFILFAMLTIIFTDFVSSKLIKNIFMRLRPYADESIADTVRLLLPHPAKNFSFTSSHAANHFGQAMFLHITLKKYWGKLTWLFFIWAFSISFAQVYVGVHFPLDVICGGLLGILVGYFCGKKFNNDFSLV